MTSLEKAAKLQDALKVFEIGINCPGVCGKRGVGAGGGGGGT